MRKLRPASTICLVMSMSAGLGVGYVPFLRFGRLNLCAIREKPVAPSPQTLGDHLRLRRIGLRLTQTETARQFGVSRYGYVWWERNFRNPDPAHAKAIIAFLGYDPRPRPTAFAEFLRWARYRLGCEQAAFASELEVPLSTLRAWERRLYEPPPTRKERFEELIERLLEARASSAMQLPEALGMVAATAFDLADGDHPVIGNDTPLRPPEGQAARPRGHHDAWVR